MTWPNEPEVHDGKTKYATNNKGRTFQADIIVNLRIMSSFFFQFNSQN